jgi:hypothetical protein
MIVDAAIGMNDAAVLKQISSGPWKAMLAKAILDGSVGICICAGLDGCGDAEWRGEEKTEKSVDCVVRLNFLICRWS